MQYPEDTTPCLAHVNPPRIYNFYATEADAQADLPSANTCILAPAEGYVVMTYAAYTQAERAFYLTGALTEITHDDWWYALEVLPPLCWETVADVNRFLMSEFQASTFTRQYARIDGRYFTRVVDAQDRTTWITRDEIRAFSPHSEGGPHNGTQN